MMIILFIVAGYAVYYILSSQGKAKQVTSKNNPIIILQNRYASGEIEEDEYRKILEVINK